MRQPPAFELAVASADHTHRKMRVPGAPSLRHSPSRVERVSQVMVCSFDVLPDLHKDIVPAVPQFSAQIRENSIWFNVLPSSHIHHHFVLLLFSQAVHGSTNVQAETLLTSSSVVFFKVQLQD